MSNRYCRRLFVSTIMVFVLTAALFVVVDPYGTSPLRFDIPWVNEIRSERVQIDRLVKPYDVLNRRPRTLITGTSRTKEGLDPERLANTPLAPAYNAGIDTMTMRETQVLLNMAQDFEIPVENVFVEVSVWNFYEIKDEYLLGSDIKERVPSSRKEHRDNYLKMFFSFDALRATGLTLVKNLNYYGSTMHLKPDGLVEIWPQNLKWSLENQIKTIHGGFTLLKARPDDQIKRYFDQMQKFSKDTGIRIQYFIQPYHPYYLAWIFISDRWVAFEEMKRLLVQYGPLVDFSRITRFSDGTVEDQVRYWYDVGHYSQEQGYSVLDVLAGKRPAKTPDNFGVILTKDNIDQHLAEGRAERDAWIAENQETYDLLRTNFLRNTAKAGG